MASLTPKQARWLVIALLATLPACTPGPSPTAVDQCELKEYLEDCEVETATKTELANCKRKAQLEATRVAAGIPAECRVGAAAAGAR